MIIRFQINRPGALKKVGIPATICDPSHCWVNSRKLCIHRHIIEPEWLRIGAVIAKRCYFASRCFCVGGLGGWREVIDGVLVWRSCTMGALL